MSKANVHINESYFKTLATSRFIASRILEATSVRHSSERSEDMSSERKHNKQEQGLRQQSGSGSRASPEQLNRLSSPYTHVEFVEQGDVKPDHRSHARSTLAQVLNVIVQDHVCDKDFDLIDGEETAGARVPPEPKTQECVIDCGALLLLLLARLLGRGGGVSGARAIHMAIGSAT